MTAVMAAIWHLYLTTPSWALALSMAAGAGMFAAGLAMRLRSRHGG